MFWFTEMNLGRFDMKQWLICVAKIHVANNDEYTVNRILFGNGCLFRNDVVNKGSFFMREFVKIMFTKIVALLPSET